MCSASNAQPSTALAPDGYPADDTDFVRMAYRFLLRRDVDPGGLDYCLGLLNAGESRATVMQKLLDSDEFAELITDKGLQWPLVPPPGYAGQLDDSVQQPLRDIAATLTLDDCEPYHATDLPNGEFIAGGWDLRGGEHNYVGGIDLSGKRVLDLGPATGHLSFWMERQGANVTAFEIGYDASADIRPSHAVDVEFFRNSMMDFVRGINNMWWYSHHAFGSNATMVYGDIYHLPQDLGQVDVALFGAILLHLERPLRAVASAAALNPECIVVTEPLDDFDIHSTVPVMRHLPGRDENLSGWWEISPAAVIKMLTVVGYGNVEVTTHQQLYYPDHDLSVDPAEVTMFTVVGRRAA